MPDKKNPIVRYMVLDSCFRNRRKRYYIDDLLEAVNNYMRVHSFQPISERQLRDDINFMEYDAGEDIELLRIQDGHSKYYQYRDPGMSMFKHQLTDDEAALISNTVKLLSRFEGLPRYDWVDETLLRLREFFQLDENIGGAVSFAQNPDLTGLQWFKPLFEAIERKYVVELDYHRFGKPTKKRILHPYQMKQWNYRWYVVGLEECQSPRLPLVVIPIDRIDGVKVQGVQGVQGGQKFKEKPADLDLDDYFYDIVGVSKLPEGKLEKVRVKAYYPAAHYMSTKPVHASQRVVEEVQDVQGVQGFKIFEWEVIPNEELVQQLIVYADQLEVIVGDFVKRKLVERAKAILENNTKNKNISKKTV